MSGTIFWAPMMKSTCWAQIVALYDQLHALRPDAVVALNRAVAVGELHGAAAGLTALAASDAEQLRIYQPYHADHADLLLRAGRHDEAVTAYCQAMELTANPAERRFLEARRAASSRDAKL